MTILDIQAAVRQYIQKYKYISAGYELDLNNIKIDYNDIKENKINFLGPGNDVVIREVYSNASPTVPFQKTFEFEENVMDQLSATTVEGITKGIQNTQTAGFNLTFKDAGSTSSSISKQITAQYTLSTTTAITTTLTRRWKATYSTTIPTQTMATAIFTVNKGRFDIIYDVDAIISGRFTATNKSSGSSNPFNPQSPKNEEFSSPIAYALQGLPHVTVDSPSNAQIAYFKGQLRIIGDIGIDSNTYFTTESIGTNTAPPTTTLVDQQSSPPTILFG